jgi:hypothetical protein
LDFDGHREQVTEAERAVAVVAALQWLEMYVAIVGVERVPYALRVVR